VPESQQLEGSVFHRSPRMQSLRLFGEWHPPRVL
jgi:hypothetical protein